MRLNIKIVSVIILMLFTSLPSSSVKKKVLGILTQYDPSVLNLSNREKAVMEDKYRRTLPGMYEYKMGKRKNLDKNFTEEDVNRIWNADLYIKEGR